MINSVYAECHADSRGTLISDILDNCPFEPQNLFAVNVSHGAQRGGHAHAQTTQMAVLLRGRALFTVQNLDKTEICAESLTHPGQSIIIHPKHFVTYTGSDFAVLLFLWDRPYDPIDYIYE